MKLPADVVEYLNVFNRGGFSAYVVGGAVRDSLLGDEPFDFDVATSAKTEDIKKLFPENDIFETGVKHGTLTVKFKGRLYETTTFRIDGKYFDKRRPETVIYTSDLKKDLGRRDFTVNALALSASGEITDSYNGLKDLSARIIRTVGDPEKRFEEDALRILRAVRFAAELGFDIEEKTFAAMIKKRGNLASVSKERIFAELNKILLGKFAKDAFIKYKEIVFEVLPVLRAGDGFDQKSSSHTDDVYVHSVKVLSLLKEKTPVTCWAALLHDSGKPFSLVVDKAGHGHFPEHMRVSADIAEKILCEMRAPNDLKKRVVQIILLHDESVGRTLYQAKKLLNEYGAELVTDLITVKFADIYAHSETGIEKYLPERIELKNNFEKIIKDNECYTLSQLALKGGDLKNYGFSGESIGKILSRVLDEVMKGDLVNSKETLISYVKEKYDCPR